jgi:membrane protein implicated in regulation of membrane protease activity
MPGSNSAFRAYAPLMSSWEVWLVLAVVLAVGEVLTTTFVLAMVSAGALAAALVAGVTGGSAALEGITFAVVSVALLVGVLPVARRHRNLPPLLRTGTAALVGSRGTALTQIDRHSGQVRLGGENWTARPYDEAVVIAAGTDVDVFEIDGATAVVHPADPLPGNGALT